jgi:UDP-2,3-diacylglucosamine hydrolase
VKPIGLIAGNGQFPLLFAQAAREQGREVVAVAHEGETLPELESLVREIHWVKLGQLGKIINTFKHAQVTEAVMAGGVAKTKLFSRTRPDLRGLSLLTKIKHLKDDGVLRTVAAELEAEGITIEASTVYLPDLLTKRGCHTRRIPNKQEERDIQFGLEVAKEIGRLDIGQTVVVRKSAIVALEAMEGTNECILRGGRLARKNAVVVKVSKPGQDLRFDVPAVGLQTVEIMIQAQAGILAVEAGKTLFFNFRESISLADKHKIAVVGV